MTIARFKWIVPGAIFLVAIGASLPTRAQTSSNQVQDNALGIAFTTLPPGWSVAPAGEFASNMIALVKTVNGQVEPVLGVGPLGTRNTSDERAASHAAAQEKVSKDTLGMNANVTQASITLAGSSGVMLQGMPGPKNVQIVLAHGGAAYAIVALGNSSLQSDQRQALTELHFIPRTAPFPAINVSARVGTSGPGDRRTIPRNLPGTNSVGPSPYAINGNVKMYVFWGNAVSAGCGSHGGALVDNCGGYFYGEGDHTGQDYYAIDWPLNLGNSIFPQTPTPQITYAGSTCCDGYWGYGNWVVLDNGWGVASYYAHLNDILVRAGTKANWSYAIGHSGTTGNSSGPHTHVVWVQNPSYDSLGRPYNAIAEPQSPLYTFSGTPAYFVYNSLYKGQTVNGW